MKAHYKTADGRIVFEVNGETPKAVFEQIAGVQGLFEAETECGLCRGLKDNQPANKGIRYSCRQDTEGNKYYGLLCLNCFAEFHFGQHRQGGGLFPKRKDQDMKPLPHRGWAKFERKKPDAAAPATNGGTQAKTSAPKPASAPAPEREYDYAVGITDDDVPF